MQNNIKISGIFYSIMAGIIAGITAFVPEFMFVTAIFSIAFYIEACVMLPYKFYAIAPLVTIFTALFFTFSPYLLLLCLIIYVPSSIACAYFIKNNESLKQVSLAGIFAGCAGIFSLIIAFIRIRGGAFSITAAQIAFKPLFDSYKAFWSDAISTYDRMSPDLSENLRNNIAELTKVIKEVYLPLIPGLIIVAVSLAVFLAVLMAKRHLYKRGFDVSFMGRFRDFVPSKAAAIMLFLSMLVSFFTEGNIGIAFSNLSVVLTAIFFAAGLALIAFWLNRLNVSKIIRTFCFIGILVLIGLLPSFSSLISGAGAVAALFDLRKNK